VVAVEVFQEVGPLEIHKGGMEVTATPPMQQTVENPYHTEQEFGCRTIVSTSVFPFNYYNSRFITGLNYAAELTQPLALSIPTPFEQMQLGLNC